MICRMEREEVLLGQLAGGLLNTQQQRHQRRPSYRRDYLHRHKMARLSGLWRAGVAMQAAVAAQSARSAPQSSSPSDVAEHQRVPLLPDDHAPSLGLLESQRGGQHRSGGDGLDGEGVLLPKALSIPSMVVRVSTKRRNRHGRNSRGSGDKRGGATSSLAGESAAVEPKSFEALSSLAAAAAAVAEPAAAASAVASPTLAVAESASALASPASASASPASALASPVSAVAPPASAVAPPASAVAPPASAVTSLASAVTPPALAVTPPASAVTPPASAVTPPASAVTPPASAVTPPASAVTPPASAVTPPASAVTPPASAVTPPASAVMPPAASPSAVSGAADLISAGDDGPPGCAWDDVRAVADDALPAASEEREGRGALGVAPAAFSDDKCDLSKSTEYNFRADHRRFTDRFRHARRLLDYSYHSNYSLERQRVQDQIIENALQLANAPGFLERPWAVFTAGAMGAGKSHVVELLGEVGFFPLDTFVRVDPDRLRRELPEMQAYLQRDPGTAGSLTHKEAGLMAEILEHSALLEGRNILVDGSMRDGEWYALHFASLRRRFPRLRVAIIHVWAPEDQVLERAARRATQTGRTIPPTILQETLRQVPRSVEKLAPLVDYCVRIDNVGDTFKQAPGAVPSGSSDDFHHVTGGVGGDAWSACGGLRAGSGEPADDGYSSDTVAEPGSAIHHHAREAGFPFLATPGETWESFRRTFHPESVPGTALEDGSAATPPCLKSDDPATVASRNELALDLVVC